MRFLLLLALIALLLPGQSSDPQSERTRSLSGARAGSTRDRALLPPGEPPQLQPSPEVRKLLDEMHRLDSILPPDVARRRAALRTELEVAVQAMSAARRAHDDAGAADAGYQVGVLLWGLDQDSAAVAALQSSATAAERAGDGPRRVDAVAKIGIYLWLRNHAE